MGKNVTKNERKRRRKLSAKLAAMLGLPIAATSCGPVDTVSNVGTNYEEPKKPVIEQETTEKTTVDMTIEEILTTRKSSTINNTVTTPNNSYNDNGYNGDYYYDDTVYLDPEDVPTYQEPGIPQYQPQTQGNTQGNAQKPTQGSTSSSTALSSKPSSKPTSTSVASSSSNKQSTSGRKTSTTSTSTTTTTKKTTATTTTTTTTTKKPETTTTQAPVIEEPVVDEFVLENIGTNINVFNWYAQKLKFEIMGENAISTSYTDYTTGAREAKLLLAMLNDGYINEEVLVQAFEGDTPDDLKNYTEFIYTITDIQETFGTDIDFSDYTLEREIGDYLNYVDEEYRYGDIEKVICDAFMNGEIPEICAYNPAVLSIMCSCDKNNTYITEQNTNNLFMNEYINNLSRIVTSTNSYTYTR